MSKVIAAYDRETRTVSADHHPTGAYVFGEKTQHCAGAIMMFLRNDGGDPWPGIWNDEDLAERLEKQMDWDAPHFETEEEFIEASREGNRRKRA